MDDRAKAGTDAAGRIRAAGVKATGPRVAILAALAETRDHPTAEQVFESLRSHHPSLSLSTVYKTIEAFRAAGLCRRVHDGGALRRVDGTPDDHDHAVCRSCERIFDVDRALFPRPASPPELPGGLALTAIHLEYEVFCPVCRASDRTIEHGPRPLRGRRGRGTTTPQREE